MKISFKNINLDLILLLFLTLAGFYFRYLNLFFEDYWIDEMTLLWEADPNISFKETMERVLTLDTSPALFPLVSKYFFKFFQYHPDTGRIFVSILGTTAIPVGYLLLREINLKKSAILFSFFICTNIYLINYSQEVRCYALLFLISLLNIFLFLKLINKHNEKGKFYLLSLCFILVNILGLFTHLFFLIIIASQIAFCAIQLFLKEKKFIKITSVLIFSLIFLILVHYDYLLSLAVDQQNHWIESSSYLNIKFFTDFFFRKFFGSKIMGAIYFFTLVLLIFKFRRKIFCSSHYLFFVVMIFLSYAIPIFYGFIKMPVLYDRYIIFVLIPIFALISALIFELKSTKVKQLVISIIVIATISNLYIEISKVTHQYKPQTKKILNSISSEFKNNGPINIYINQEDGLPTFFDYVVKLDEFKKNNFKIVKLHQLSSIDDFWMICYVDVCHAGICYKDLLEENSQMEIPNWSSRKSCPSLRKTDSNEDPYYNLRWKRSFSALYNKKDQSLISNYQNPFLEKKFKIKKIIKKNHPHQKIIGKYYIK